MPTSAPFSRELFKFLRDVDKNQDRDWFAENKERHDSWYKDAGLDFIAAVAPKLGAVAPHVIADPKPVGGSLMRIYRDTRFSKDKSPYKTWLGMGFHHKATNGKEGSPGYFLHVAPDECGLWAGVWHPDGAGQKKIRDAIVADPKAWQKATKGFTMHGESLKRPPRGYDPEHPLVAELKRKDFVAGVDLKQSDIVKPTFTTDFVKHAKKLSPLNKFLADALALPW